MPDLVRYQLKDGPHAGEPTTERGEVERLARECRTAACQAGLDSAVIETRFDVVRSTLPETVRRPAGSATSCHSWIRMTRRRGPIV